MDFRIIAMSLTFGSLMALPAEAEELACESEYCRSNLHPFPESGLWFDHDEPGTGFTLEMQNRILAGYWFGYDSAGDPAWYLLSGELEPIETQDGGWRLETDLYRFEGGNCLGCEFESPADPELVGAIELEFPARTRARYRVDDGAWHEMTAFTFGVGAREVFEDSGDHVPDMAGWWTLVYQDRELEVTRNWRWATASIEVLVSSNLDQEERFSAGFAQVSGIEHLPVGDLQCEVGEDGPGGVCEINIEYGAELRINTSNAADKTFFMPVSNLSESYFFARSPEGDTLEGFRTSYPLGQEE